MRNKQLTAYVAVNWVTIETHVLLSKIKRISKKKWYWKKKK